MRRFLTLAVLIVSLQPLISQNLNIAAHEGIDETGGMVSINSKMFYFGSTQNYCCGYNIYIKGIDHTGNTVITCSVPISFDVKYPGKIIKTNDNALLISYFVVESCDLDHSFDYIAKVDTNGTILFNVPLQALNTGGPFPTINDITQHPDSSFYIVSSTHLYHFSSAGSFISKITLPLTGVTLVKSLPTGNLFVSGKINGITTNAIISPAGVIFKQQPSAHLLAKLIDTPTHFYAKTDINTLEKYDTSLVLLSDFGISPASSQYKVTDFTTRNDSIFVVGNNGSGNTLYHTILDNYFNIQYLYTSQYKGIYPTGITVNNKNNINVIATCNSKQSPLYKFSGFYQFKIGSGFISHSDIGVVGFSNLNTSLLGKGNGIYIHPYITADVTVKNYGYDTVKTFYLNYYSFIHSGIAPCYVLLHKFVDATILPGDSLTVATGTFYGQVFMAGSFKENQKKLNICIFTTVPNASNDIEIDNDAFCDSVMFTVTSLNEDEIPLQTIQIYPNPSASDFTIHSDIEITTLEVINSLGKVVMYETVNAKEYYLKGTGLKPGVYFIKLETEKGVFQKKIIKAVAG